MATPWVRRGEHSSYRLLLPDWILVLTLLGLVSGFFLGRWVHFQVANAAHFSGLAVGLLFGGLTRSPPWPRLARAGLLGLCTASVLGLLYAPWQVAWHQGRTWRVLQAGDRAQALAMLAAMRLKFPQDSWTLETLARLHDEQGDFLRYRDDLEALVRLQPEAPTLNELAWLLATCRVDEVRNGQRAVLLARQACALKPQSNYLDTLAAALAEAGDFEEAIRVSLRSLKGTVDVDEYKEHLASFRARRPLRLP